MEPIVRTRVLLAALILAPGAALADQAAGDACAEGLSDVGKTMYAAAAPHVTADSNLRNVVREHVRPMVESGELTPDEARGNGRDVLECLNKLRS